MECSRVNAFTEGPFGGNPAAVCILTQERDDTWLQYVAKDLNLSETAFLIKKQENEYNLRWFTPTIEVDLCGHATLAAAHMLFSTEVKQKSIQFYTKSGVLIAHQVAGYDIQNNKGVIELDFPLVLAKPCGLDETAHVCDSLGISSSVWCGKTHIGDYLVELSSSEDVKQLKPRFELMLNFPGRGGVIVTAKAPVNNDVDFLSRFFAPKSGVLEDPVTGSAHCTLGPYWAQKLEKNKLKGYQASERGGKVVVIVNEGEGRVRLQGAAITVFAGKLFI